MAKTAIRALKEEALWKQRASQAGRCLSFFLFLFIMIWITSQYRKIALERYTRDLQLGHEKARLL